MYRNNNEWDVSRIVPILEALEKVDSKLKVIAIDGRCASGKTTLAQQLAKVTGAGVIQMDHFFLPEELRTPQRLQEPGGNIHYERFKEEVLPALKKPNAFYYNRFDCSNMCIGERCSVSAGVIRIVEGVYSCHPYFKEYMNLRVFCDVSPLEQRKRIKSRDGEKMMENFLGKWIPMEEKYFESYRIREKADVIV